MNVGVEVEVEGLDLEPPEEGEQDLRVALSDSLVEEFREVNAFSEVSAAAAGARSGDDRDALLRISVWPISREDLPETTSSTTLSVLTGVLWFAAGIPSWFIRERTYDPYLAAELRVERTGLAEGTSMPPQPFEAASQDLSFWDRASFGQYFVQILVPPPLLPANEEMARDSLTEMSLEDVVIRAAHYARRELPLEYIRQTKAFVCMPKLQADASPTERRGDVVVLARTNIAGIWVNGAFPQATAELGMPRFIEKFRVTEPKETLGVFESVLKYLDELARGDESLVKSVPSVANLRRWYTRVYAFTLEDLRDGDGNLPSRLEIQLDDSGDHIGWTLAKLVPSETGE
jgi:hypothetical protein